MQGYQGKWVMLAWKGGYTAASRSQPCAWRHALQIGASVETLQRVVQSRASVYVCTRRSMARVEALEGCYLKNGNAAVLALLKEAVV